MSALGQKRTFAVAIRHVCFTSISDRESEFPHKVMSALPPKADMCGAIAHVCFGPKGDISQCDRGASYAAISRQGPLRALAEKPTRVTGSRVLVFIWLGLNYFLLRFLS